MEELIDLITEDRLTIYKEVMEGKYDIQKGKKWQEDAKAHTMTVRSIEMFEKVVPIFVSMSKMYEVEDIKDIFNMCRTGTGNYNFAAIKRIRLLINMVYNYKRNRLDVPIQDFMNSTYDFVLEHTDEKGKAKCTVGEINEFIWNFVQSYAKKESTKDIIITVSPVTIDEMNKMMHKIFKCLVEVGKPNKNHEIKMHRAELIWVEREVKEAHRESVKNSKLFQLSEFMDAMKISEEDVNMNIED